MKTGITGSPQNVFIKGTGGHMTVTCSCSIAFNDCDTQSITAICSLPGRLRQNSPFCRQTCYSSGLR